MDDRMDPDMTTSNFTKQYYKQNARAQYINKYVTSYKMQGS